MTQIGFFKLICIQHVRSIHLLHLKCLFSILVLPNHSNVEAPLDKSGSQPHPVGRELHKLRWQTRSFPDGSFDPSIYATLAHLRFKWTYATFSLPYQNHYFWASTSINQVLCNLKTHSYEGVVFVIGNGFVYAHYRIETGPLHRSIN